MSGEPVVASSCQIFLCMAGLTLGSLRFAPLTPPFTLSAKSAGFLRRGFEAFGGGLALLAM
jgi:hypothetical protein